MTLIDNNTTVISNNTNDSSNWLLQSSLWSVRLVCPLFIILSPLFNWACIRIFQSRTYARSSTRWYFIFIAIFDTIYVVVTAPLLFLLTFQIYILNWNIVFCKSILFFNYLSCQISAGLLACLSVDRFVATSCLSVYRHTCTANFSKVVCFIVISVLSILNSHYLIGYTIDEKGYCNIKRYKWYEANYSRLNVVYLLSYSIIPFTIIAICNIFIVLTVCQNKTKLRKKYDMKKRSSCHHDQNLTPNGSVIISKILQNSADNSPVNQKKHEMFATIGNKKVLNSLLDSNSEWQSHRSHLSSEKLFFNVSEIPINSTETSSTFIENKQLNIPLKRDRSLSANLSSSPTNSQKMCIQLQITISLLAISICFIFCTLPNCISTIMIQTYTNDENVRKFWQAMNYFSIVPLLITHSVNFIFYYLSSSMFRDRIKEYFLKKRT